MSEKSPLSLTDPITKIPYVGLSQAETFKRLGISSVEDLFNYLPRDILDLSVPIAINKAAQRRGQKVAVKAEIKNVTLLKTPKRRLWLVQAELHDSSGETRAIWFNQPYLKKYLDKLQKAVFYGEFTYDYSIRSTVLSNPQIYTEATLMPIYPLTEGISSRQISNAVKRALQSGYEVKEFLPRSTSQKNNLMDLAEAVRQVHRPKDLRLWRKAKERLIFNSLLVFIMANLFQGERNKTKSSYKIKIDLELIKKFINSLPFELTEDQKKVMKHILLDFKSPHPMNRLIEGEVGSGKTVVALGAALLAVKSKFRTVWLAPTEILANQHYETAKKFLKEFGVKVALLTAASKTKLKIKNQKSKNAVQNADLIIGTHAVLQKGVKIKNVGLVVVDEQHRFGVKQRSHLAEKAGFEPHFLSLSATPIPRTLAHVIFGNLDVSLIRSQPKGRLRVKTYLIPEQKRAASYEFINSLIAQGQQVFVICPLIEQKVNLDDTLFDISVEDKKTVETELKNLKKTVLGRRKIVALHGRMKSKEKEQIMKEMKSGQTDVLVSTSVVEVGVDIPRATAMIIENAERFGLSQLHQFRGRIGRNNLQSYCFLFSGAFGESGARRSTLEETWTHSQSGLPRAKAGKNIEEKTKARLKAFVQNNDGFKLAEMDLKLRGPGAILGLEQAGFKGFNPLWFANSRLLAKASNLAKELLGKLNFLPELKQKVMAELETEHLE